MSRRLSSSPSSLKCNETFIVELNCVQILRHTLFKSNPSHTQPNSHTLSIVHVAHPPAPRHASPTIWQWMAQMCHHHIVYTCTHLSHLHIITHYYHHFGNCSPCFRCFSDVFTTWCHDERVSSSVWQMTWRNCSRHISCVCVCVTANGWTKKRKCKTRSSFCRWNIEFVVYSFHLHKTFSSDWQSQRI